MSVALDPLNKYIASSACDGSVCIWSIESRKVCHQWKNVFPRSNDFENSSTLCRIEWQPSLGDVLAIPISERIELFKRGQWDKAWKKITHSELSDLSIATFSHNGKLVAAATTNGFVMVWKMAEIQNNHQQPLSILNISSTIITSLKFNNNNPYQLCCCDKTGSLRILKILIPSPPKSSIISPNVSPHQTIDSINTSQNKPGISQEDLENLFEDIDDDDFSYIKNFSEKKETGSNTAKNVISDVKTSSEINQIISLSVNNKNKTDPITLNYNDSNLSDDVDSEFDISAIKSRYEPMIFGEEMSVRKKDNFKGTNTFNTGANTCVNTKSLNELIIDGHKINGKELLSLLRQPRISVQLPFQSGSTPTHYKQRFMVWNSVGIVYGYNTDEERSIDVEFHDISFHHSIHITNDFNYTMADLSSVCLLLASNGDDEADDELEHTKARLFCRLFNTWDSIKEWQIDLPKEEQIDTIAAGQTFVAIATSQLYLRIWTVGGIQTLILSLNGPTLNLSAYDRIIMILYHQTAHIEQGQSIACQVLKIDHKGKTRCHPIPTPVPVAISPKATAYWAGFTDEGTPCIVDSDGIIRLYKSHFGNGWFPICSTKEHVSCLYEFVFFFK